jgi:hypothetical protein
MSDPLIVFEVWFTREYDGRKDTQLRIGVYETETEAQTVVESLKSKTGFSDFPDGFQVLPLKLGHAEWREGFVTKYGPSPKDANGEAFDLPAWIDD